MLNSIPHYMRCGRRLTKAGFGVRRYVETACPGGGVVFTFRITLGASEIGLVKQDARTLDVTIQWGSIGRGETIRSIEGRQRWTDLIQTMDPIDLTGDEGFEDLADPADGLLPMDDALAVEALLTWHEVKKKYTQMCRTHVVGVVSWEAFYANQTTQYVCGDPSVLLPRAKISNPEYRVWLNDEFPYRPRKKVKR